MTTHQFRGGYQPPPRRRRGRGLSTGRLIALGAAGPVLAVLIAVALGDLLGGGTSGARPPAAGPMPGIGQVARDGGFAFTVQGEVCGAAAARAVSGRSGAGETIPPGATECIFTVKVTNDGGTPDTFLDSNQYGFDAAGRQFATDSTGAFYLHGDQNATQLNPGMTIIARVPFQIPASDTITRLELHGSMFSHGVLVRV